MNHFADTKTICLVGCGKKKLSQATFAKDIYTSYYFCLKRQYAEKFADSWFIISAKHHLLSPNQIIEPYDKTLTNAGVKAQRDWAAIVAEQLGQVANPKDTIIILAGKDYFKQLLPLIQEFNTELPLKGLGQSEQNRQLKNYLEKGTPS
jgi:hypothetical protein